MNWRSLCVLIVLAMSSSLVAEEEVLDLQEEISNELIAQEDIQKNFQNAPKEELEESFEEKVESKFWGF